MPSTSIRYHTADGHVHEGRMDTNLDVAQRMVQNAIDLNLAEAVRTGERSRTVLNMRHVMYATLREEAD